MLLAVTGVVHVIRGAPLDAVIFLGVAAALTVTELTGPAPVTSQRQLPNRPLLVLAGAVVFGVAVGWTQFGLFGETTLIVAGVLALLAVWRQGDSIDPAQCAPRASP